MKKVSLEELGKILGDECSDFFESYYSDDYLDYKDDLERMAINSNYDENEDLYKGDIEIADKGKVYHKDICFRTFNNNLDVEYYI